MRSPISGLLTMFLLVCGCSAGRQVISTTETQKEQVRVVYRTETVPVLVKFKFPELSAERNTIDSLSRLENKYAVSEAAIRKDGTLYHDLKTKPQTIECEAEAKVEYKDSIVFRDREVLRDVPIPVETPLTWWQVARLKGFWVLLALLAFAYRKLFFKLIKLLV